MGISWENDFLQMHILNSMDEHGAVFFFQDVFSYLDFIIRPDSQHETVERRVVQFAQCNAVVNDGISTRFSIGDDVGRVEQFKMLHTGRKHTAHDRRE